MPVWCARVWQLQSWLNYSVNSITSGSEDLGVKYEQYQAISDQRRIEQAQSREQVRRAIEGAFVNGADDEKPAA